MEQVGPVTVDRVRSWLGHTHVTVKPVIDLNDQIPVDAYEIPDRIREAVHLTIPVDCFPHATSTRTGVFVWRTPHGRYLLVDPTGTHRRVDSLPALPAA